MKMKTILAAISVALGVTTATVADPMHSQLEVERGVWCSDFAASKEYADANNIPMIIFWANPGCSQCEKMESALNKDAFKVWQKLMNAVMVFSYNSGKDHDNCKNFVKNSSKKFPYMAVYWKKNTLGFEILEKFTGRSGYMTAYGASKTLSLDEQFMVAVENILFDWEPDTPEPGPAPEPTIYTVNFVVDAAKGNVTGGGSLSQQVESGKGAVAPTVAAKEGWEFTGWDKSFSKVTANLTVNATFAAIDPDPDPEPTFYTVNFVVDAEKGTVTGGGSLSQQVESGKGAVAPTVTANEGWEFNGWDKSFSKVTANLTVNATFAEVKPREEVSPSVVYKAARTLSALVYEDGDLVGTASLKMAKISKKGEVKVTLKISPFSGLGATASFKAAPNEFGDLEGVFSFKKSMGGAMECQITFNDGDFTVAAANDRFEVELGEVSLGGSFDTDELTFSADIDIDLGDSWDLVVDPPMAEPVHVRKGTLLSFDKVPSIKYKKYKEDGESWYELTGLDDEVKTNVNGLKLTYKPATGVFSGSFKVYASNEFAIDEGKSPKLKVITVSVSGVVVDGVGIGVVKSGKFVGACTLD